MLNEQQKAKVDALLDELLDLPEPARWAHLSTTTIADPAVRAEVVSLLRASESVGDFLSKAARPEVPEDDDGLAVGTRLGGWRITGRLGRGGMGDVYSAARAQGDFDQRVAIKVLQRGARSQLERFQAERQILARLEHPAIARLLDGGTTADGRPYMVMEYVEGRSITDYCASLGAPLEQRLKLFVQVCDAVAYAHSNLIIHRDLKPSNILVTAGGQVKLLDFGIAKLIDTRDESLTQAAHVPMTPICAAPEQLTGKPVTTATDTYALGLLLFELLTGAHPWNNTTGAPMVQALRTVLNRAAPVASVSAAKRDETPVPPRVLRGDLDAIIAKALREEPTHRYATVQAFKLDVERYMRGESVEARAGAKLYVLGRSLRRHRWAVAALTMIVLSLAGGLGAAAWQARRAGIERDNARRDAAREEAVRYSLTSLFRTAIAEKGSEPTTAKTMIDSSAQRVLHEYRDQPRLAGQIVLTLADLYGALEDVEGAGALLEGFVANAGSDVDPVALADARQKLANIEFLRGHTDRCAQLLDQAAAFWNTAPDKYRQGRLENLGTRAKVQRARGDLDGAIATSREAIAQRTVLSGRNDRETAVLYNSLAITLTSANRLEEALTAYRETLDIYRAIGLGDGLDAQIILANTGTLELRTGHLKEAETLLKNAFERERALAGDSAAVAAAMGYYGRVLTIRNRNVEAVAVLREVVDLGTRYAGPASPVTLQGRMFLGAAQLGAGDIAGARATLSAAQGAALKEYGEAHPLSLRARLAMVQASAGAVSATETKDEITKVIAALRKLGAQAQATLAEALETLASAQLSDHDVPDAVASLREAVTLRAKTGAQTWELGIARERLGEALQLAGDAEAATNLKQGAAILEAQLGAEHPETQRARSALAKVRGS